MLAELGQLACAIALAVAILLTIIPLLGSYLGRVGMMQMARPAAYCLFLLVLAAFGLLATSFIQNDFSLIYVAQNSNSALPLQFRIAAVWGAHEGSLLLWCLILASWTALLALFSRQLPLTMQARVLAVMGSVSVGFLQFMLFTSNPFETSFPAPADGQDLNPLLQDFALIIHPPILYMGYVGFSVAFAFTFAALISRQGLDAVWARWMRPWTTMAWVFLTIGIALGSWWAYYELGWGGWWFWDPVENASFMPWLAGTALIHSLAVTEKRKLFVYWSSILAISAFGFSLLGTFLVRSGLLVSVHSFTTDPERGVNLLILMGIFVGIAMLAWIVRTVMMLLNTEESDFGYGLLSREAGLMINNILLAVLTCVVFWGTLYPLAMDILANRKLSIGPPYFDSLFLPLGIALMMFMAIGTTVNWKRESLASLWQKHRLPLALTLIASLTFVAFAGQYRFITVVLGVAAAIWVIASASSIPLRRIRQQSLQKGLRNMPLSQWGMVLAHIGIAVFAIGVAITETGSQQKDLVMLPGERLELNGYDFTFNGVTNTQGPNYQAKTASVDVFDNGQALTTLSPEKRFYNVQKAPMTEAGIDPSLWRDIYVSLGEPAGDNGAWSLRFQVKPMVRWIWLGCILMALGGLLAGADKRYRRAQPPQVARA